MPSNKGYDLDTSKGGVQNGKKTPNLEKTLSMSKGDNDEEVDTSCGYLCCKPSCSNSCCNTSKGLSAAVTFFAFEYGIIQLGVVNIIIVPLQRRYGFTATQAAWIPAAQDFFGGIFAICIGYIGTFVHKGRLLTLAACAQFIAGSLFIMVHFISPIYEAGEADMEVCDPENPPGCDHEVGDYTLYFWILIFAQMLHGYCGGTIFCVAVPYMDDNTKPKNTPVYIGIMYGAVALGAMVGYIIGGLSLLVYVDIGRVDMDDIDITPGDPRWVGAWWIPYVVGVFGATIAIFYVGAYPKYVPGAQEIQAKRMTEAYDGGALVSTSQSRLSQVWQSTKLLFTNPTWVLLTIAGIFESGMMNGFIIFFPAIIVFQFDQNPAEAAIVAGVVIVPAAILGQILGGLIPKWFNFGVKGLIKQTGIMALIVALMAPVMLLRCPTPDIAGVTVAFHDTNKEIAYKNLTGECNIDCGCDTRAYDPICGTNNIQYFTPCHAACTGKKENDDGDEIFYDCACIPTYDETFDATDGACDSECRYFEIFLAVFFFAVLAIFIGVTSGIAATVRCVPESERSYGAGLQSTIVRFLGNVPIPVLMGVIFDQSCLVWQYTCDDRGSCWLYDPASLAVGLALIVLITKTIAIFCHLFAVLLYKEPPAEVMMEHEVIIDNHLFNVNYVACKPPSDDFEVGPQPEKVPIQNGVIFTVGGNDVVRENGHVKQPIESFGMAEDVMTKL